MDIQTYDCSNYQKIFVNIKNITPSVSVLYFTDENQKDIPIPPDTLMYAYYNEKPTILPPHKECFYICYTDNYELIIHGKVRHLTNKRSWSLDSCL